MASKTKKDVVDEPKGSYFTKRQIARAWEAPPESDESMPRYGGHNMQTPDPTGEGIEAERLSHLVLGVTDLDRSEEYYRDFFGMAIAVNSSDGESRSNVTHVEIPRRARNRVVAHHPDMRSA